MYVRVMHELLKQSEVWYTLQISKFSVRFFSVALIASHCVLSRCSFPNHFGLFFPVLDAPIISLMCSRISCDSVDGLKVMLRSVLCLSEQKN